MANYMNKINKKKKKKKKRVPLTDEQLKIIQDAIKRDFLGIHFPFTDDTWERLRL